MSATPGKMGYAIELERPHYLEAHGHDPELMLRGAATIPAFNPDVNPLDVFDVKDQGQMGSCQGVSLSGVVAACYYRMTGRKEVFSGMAAYILSQRQDGIRGDQGSTLSGGQRVITQHGLCLESEWPYPRSYNTTEPNPRPNYAYRLKVSKPFRDVDVACEWMDQGLPIHWGIVYGDEMNRETVDSFAGRGGGGHAIFTWCRRADGTYNNIGSWGSRYLGDGVQGWTKKAMREMLAHRWTVAIGYAPADMEYPTPDPIG